MEIPRQDEPIALEGGEVHFRDFDLEPQEFLHVRAEQQGIDVAVGLERHREDEEEGELLLRVDSPTGRYGPEELLFIAQEAGRYRVVVEAPQGAPAGHYTFQVVTQRPATPEDEELTEADRLYWEGRRLLKERSYSQAAESLEQGRDVFTRRELSRREGDALEGLCLARQGQGAAEVALELCDQAVARYRQVEDRHFLPFLLDRAGWLRLRLGRAGEAVERFEEALSLFAESDETRGSAAALAHLGSAHHALGRLDKAQEVLGQALEKVRATSDRRLEGAVLCDLASALLALRRPEEALDRYMEALAIYRQGTDSTPLAAALTGLADAAVEARDFHRAEEALKEALDALPEDREPRNRAVALNARGNLLRRKRDLAAAQSDYEEALKLAREAGDRHTEAVILLDLGYLLVLRGDPARGFDLCQQARDRFVKLEDLRGEASARVRGAEALRDLTRLREAWEWARAGLGLIEGLHVAGEVPAAEAEAKVDQPADEPAAQPPPSPIRPDYYEIAVDILMGLYAQDPRAGYHLQALDLNERRLLQATAGAVPKGTWEPELQTLLDQDTLIVVVGPGETRSTLWALTSEEMAVHRLPSWSELSGWAHELIQGQEATPSERFDRARLDVGRHLLGPVAEHLGRRRLFFVTAEPLRSVPFHLLPDLGPGSAGETLEEGHEIQALPSLSAFLQEMEGQGREVVRSAHRSIEEAGVPDEPVNPSHSDLPGGEETGGALSEEMARRVAVAQAAYRERRRREAFAFREGEEGAEGQRVVRAGQRSIEEAGVPSEPVNASHSDLPGGGDLEWSLSEDVQRRLAAAQAAYRKRRRREALAFQQGEAGSESKEVISPGQRPIEEAGVPDDPVNTSHSDLPGEEGPSGEVGTAGAQDEPEALPDFDPQQLSQLLVTSWRQETPDYKDEVDLCREYEVASKEEIELRKRRRELPYGVDPHDLAQTGWAVLFSRDEDPEVHRYLSKLLDRRQEQAGRRYKALTYYPGESARKFLWYRNGEAPGVIDPDVLPYYILIVGDPETIPYEFQYELSINHAVGRIHFDDPANYAGYAESVLNAEEWGVDLPRRADFFTVENKGDEATQILAQHLATPLAKELDQYSGWKMEVWDKTRAYKRDLQQLLAGPGTPGLLLVSCHGRKLPVGHGQQEAYQGALLCQDWIPGRVADESQFFHADDVEGNGNLHGLIAFLFACYGAGTPLVDNFPHEVKRGMLTGKPPAPEPLTPRPFVARLPQALLRNGALAVVGHVDRGWTVSYKWDFKGKSAEATRNLQDCLKQLMDGHRIGHTLRPLARRYSAIATQLAESMERVRNGEPVDREMVAFQWTAHNDARNLVLLGDPAVYLLGQKCGPAGSEGGEETQGAERSWQPPPADAGTSGGPAEAHSARSGPRGFATTSPLYLDEGVARYATEKARQRGMSVDQWVNAVLRSRAEDDGFPL